MEFQDALKSLKDCRVCHRRRIKCDRSLPKCRKCAKKNILCSGYGISLKWDQGVASRGKLAGRTVPLTPQTDPPPAESHSQSAAITNRSSTALTHIPPLRSLQKFSSPPLESQNVRYLLHHYNHVIAANMTWTDSSENPWRDIIIPMAMESPLVLLSILTFAAKHISTMAQSALQGNESKSAAGYSRIYGSQALRLLAQELRPLTSDNQMVLPASVVDNHTSRRHNVLLATMLVLCNVETVRPDSSVWRLHLNAAHTVLASRHKETIAEDSTDNTATFLRQELSIANTFASLTNFSLFNDDDYSKRELGGPFAEFLKLLHMITRLERQAFQNPDSIFTSRISPDGFQQLFEHARAHTLKLSSAFKLSPPEERLQFNRIVNSFYHAGLIYSYQALFRSPSFTRSSIESQIRHSFAELFQILKVMEMEKPSYALDLVWPLFIAGTEASNAEEQEIVVRKLEQAMQGTGFSNCEHALEFLRALWAEREEKRGKLEISNPTVSMGYNWIPFARDWEAKGHVFWVF